jgi:hypothetical protein
MALLIDFNGGSTSSYLVLEFVSEANGNNTEFGNYYYPAISCLDLYSAIYGGPDKIPTSLAEILEGDFWKCPAIGTDGNYTLANDPFFTGSGAKFNFVVNLCQYSYSGDKTNCVTNKQSIVNYIYNVQLVF